MENIILEIIKTGKERLKYPIISIYIIVLILWNWDVLSYFLLSDNKIETRIKFIEKNYTDSAGRVLYPLAKAILLAIIIPLIMWGLEALLHVINGGRRKIRNKNNDDIRQEKIKAADAEFKIKEALTGTKTIQDWEEKVKQLEVSLEAEKKNSNSLSNQIEELTESYNLQIQREKKELTRYQQENLGIETRDLARSEIDDFMLNFLPELNQYEKKQMVYEILGALLNKNDFYKFLIDKKKHSPLDYENSMKIEFLPEMKKRNWVYIKKNEIMPTLLGFTIYEVLNNQIIH